MADEKKRNIDVNKARLEAIRTIDKLQRKEQLTSAEYVDLNFARMTLDLVNHMSTTQGQATVLVDLSLYEKKLCQMYDSSQFDFITMAYLRLTLNELAIDNELRGNIMSKFIQLQHEYSAESALRKNINLVH